MTSLNRSRERALFNALLRPDERAVSARALREALTNAGIRADDVRTAGIRKGLEERQSTSEDPIEYDEFADIIRPGVLLLDRVLKQQLVIPDFSSFSNDLRGIFERTIDTRGGAVADYIPQLSRVDPELYGVSVCTIDGQRTSLGDADTPFSAQCTHKPITYCLALEEHGEEGVHRHMGCEPSGQSFNEITLDKNGRPHNPMLNAGTIMCGALVRQDLDVPDKFDYVTDVWTRLAGGVRPGFDNTIYLSERRTADRNFALGYFLREKKVLPENADLIETLEFHFQCCSLEVTAELIAMVGSTLANGGVCPLTGQRIFSAQSVQKCLSLMYSCGMYDFSGEWAFRIGLPAKSGVSGVIMIVVPNVMGICTWSPRLDEHGNSVRGIDFCRELVQTFNFHKYDNLLGGLHGKRDPRIPEVDRLRNLQVDLCWAASEGDLDGIQRLVLTGADVDAADYDGRTALHLAASEGRDEVVSYLLVQGVDPAPVDRWGGTPLDDARRGQHERVIQLLESAGLPPAPIAPAAPTRATPTQAA